MKIEKHLSYDEYDSQPGLRWSHLKELEISPLQFQHRSSRPPLETPAMTMGKAAHTAILEPDKFPLEYAVFTGARRAGKDWEAFEAANVGKTIIKADQYADCLSMRDAVRGHHHAAQIIARCEVEVSAFWLSHGTECKGRMDMLGDGVVADLKTTRDLVRFESTSARYGYHAQLAWYAEGLLALGRQPSEVYIIAVQSAPPWDVVVYRLPEGVLEVGGAIAERLMQLHADCTESGKWPGMGAEIRDLLLPAWANGAGDDDELELTIGGERHAL